LAQRLRQLGQTFRNLQRFREIVGVFLKYGCEDLAHRVHLPRLLGLPTRRLRAEADESEPVPDALEGDVAGFMHRQFPASVAEIRSTP
jgi:hypothetical protein